LRNSDDNEKTRESENLKSLKLIPTTQGKHQEIMNRKHLRGRERGGSDKNKQMTHHQTGEFPTKFSKMKGRNIKQKNKRMTL